MFSLRQNRAPGDEARQQKKHRQERITSENITDRKMVFAHLDRGKRRRYFWHCSCDSQESRSKQQPACANPSDDCASTFFNGETRSQSSRGGEQEQLHCPHRFSIYSGIFLFRVACRHVS